MHNRPRGAQLARKQEKLNESPTDHPTRGAYPEAPIPDRWSDPGDPRSPTEKAASAASRRAGAPSLSPRGAGTGPVGLLSDPRQTPHRGAGGWQSQDPFEAP